MAKRIKLEEWPFETFYTREDFPKGYGYRKPREDVLVQRRFRFLTKMDRDYGELLLVEFVDKRPRLWSPVTTWADPRVEAEKGGGRITFAPNISDLITGDSVGGWDEKLGPEGFLGDRLCFPLRVPDEDRTEESQNENTGNLFVDCVDRLRILQRQVKDKTQRRITLLADQLAKTTSRLERLRSEGEF